MDCFNCPFPDCINDYVKPSSWQTLTDEQKARYNIKSKEIHKRLYKERKEKGLCVRCGLKSATNGVYCLECYIRRKNQRDKKKRHINQHIEWNEKGLCYVCGDVCEVGHKVCKKHLDIKQKAIQKCLSSKSWEDNKEQWQAAASFHLSSKKGSVER